ncbi:DUF3363 domain-containing protein [Xylophilus sp.]|uniref:DUF3363 domain-containing protein n=1 Tax=Xylophilus sp. TaxID=2653893 RepID=UPI0013BA747F|nr:MAG: hypothetical protein GAK38_01193 [Xylophilus sp.]
MRVERFAEPRLQRQRQVLIGRLQHLQRMGLASEPQRGVWAVHADAEPTPAGDGRARRHHPHDAARHERQAARAGHVPAGGTGRAIVDHVVGKGLAEGLYDKGYLIVDGTDGNALAVAWRWN